MDRLLLTDGQQRKTLAAVRSLGGKGAHVLVADETRWSTSRYSRYCAQGLVCPPPHEAARYWSWLLDTCHRNQVDVLLPMDDLTTELMVMRSTELPAAALLPTPEQFRSGRDKAVTASLAERASIRAPRTLEVNSLAEAQEAARRMSYSVVLKARRAAGGRGLYFISSPAELATAWSKIRPEWGGFLIQERIPFGRKFDVCLLFGPGGDLRASFVQEELRWFPLEFGASTLQESVHRPDLVALAIRLLAPIGWRGPVEVEFMLDPDGAPVLMEINPRFWASLALAIRCGVDFPGLVADLAAGRNVHGPESFPTGIRCRWLLPGDLLHAVAKRGRGITPPFFRTLDQRTFDDIIARDDPGPTFGVFSAFLRYVFDPAMWKVLMRW